MKTPTSNTSTNEGLKEFFTSLVDARPEFAAQIRQACINDRRGLVRDEHWHLKDLADGEYLQILLHPQPQKGASGSATSDES